MAAEARIAARFGYPVQAGGGTPAGASAAAHRLIQAGARGLVSFGLAGGLNPPLRPGTMLIPSVVLADGSPLLADAALAARFGGLTGHTVLAGSEIVADAAAKRRLHESTGADAVDLESGAVARAALAGGLPFIVLRAVCDPAERDLPPAALIALNADGSIGLMPILLNILRQPGQLPALLRLARDAAQARRSLIGLAQRFRLDALMALDSAHASSR